MTPLNWSDDTGYSQHDKERIPRTWLAHVDAIRVVVTRRNGLSGWYYICEPWHSLKPLGDMTAEEAKKAAGRQIRSDARALMDALGAE